MHELELPDRTLKLQRLPLLRDDPQRAWDAADEYLLAHLREQDGAGRLLLVDDAFGALAAALHARRPTSWSDSHLGRLALAHNLGLNALAEEAVAFVPGAAEPDGAFALALVKLPKSLARLEDLLLRLRACLEPGARVVLGGMIKHTPMRAYRLLEEIVGPTTTSQGVRKARLAFATFDPDRELPPRLPDTVYALDDGAELRNRPGLFSRERLDAGTRLLLAHLPRTDTPLAAADLGSGNGVLALALARACPGAAVLGVDESYEATACAAANAAAWGLADRVRFIAADGLAETPHDSLDLVVCNPPFHQSHAVGDLIAWRLMEQARRALRPGGELRVVGNRHLGYHVKLTRLFGGCEVLGSDERFVVLRADVRTGSR